MPPYSSYTDQELAALLKKGDHAAYAEIYTRYFGVLYVHAYRRLNDGEETNDLLQDLFSAIWFKREDLVVNVSLSSYLYSAVRKRILNFFEKRKVIGRYTVSLAGFVDQDYEYADHKVRESQLRKLIEAEIAKLPEPLKSIFLMSRNEQMSYKEIGEQLGMTEQAVKSHMKRILKTFRAKFGLLGYLMFISKLF